MAMPCMHHQLEVMRIVKAAALEGADVSTAGSIL